MRSGMIGFLGAQRPSAGDPYWANVSSLLHFDGADGSTTFADQTGRIWTPSGNAKIDAAQSRWPGGASLLLDGSGDYLTTTNTTDISFSGADGTLQVSVRPAASKTLMAVATKRPTSGDSEFGLWISNGFPRVIGYGGVGQFNAVDITSDIAVPLNAWSDIAVRVSGATWQLYIGDTLVGEAISTDEIVYKSGLPLRIGRDSTNAARDFVGHIDEFRHTYGIARTITALTGPFPNFGPPGTGDPYWANVVSLLEFDGADGSTIITDAKGKIWTAHGNAKLSTARKVGGVSSLLLDGTGDYISTPYHADFDFGTGDFTMEWYQYLNLLSPLSPFDFRGGVANSPRPLLYNTYSPAGTDLIYYLSGANRISAPSGTISVGTFQHIALCRVSGVTRLFVGGVQRGASYADATSYTNAGVFIGRNSVTTDRDFNGNFDGWRVTKGVGRYASSFTPPTLPYPQG